MPSAEALVGWLLEHQELQVPQLSDSDSLSSIEGFSDSDSTFDDDYEDMDGSISEVCRLYLQR